MAYKCSFLDNETYSAQDVNDIFARITSGGVIFTDTGYTFGDLNAVQSEIATDGVTRDVNSCKVVKVDDTYKISKGVCFMNDGSAIIFDEDGQEIEITNGVENYVYLKRNVVANSIDIVVSEEAWDEESIPLAIVDEEGIVIDRRKYARAKIELATSGNIQNVTVNIPKSEGVTSDEIEIDMGDPTFSYVTVWDAKVLSDGDESERVTTGKNLVELIENEAVVVQLGEFDGDKEEQVHFRKDGQKLYVCIIERTGDVEYTINIGVI